MNHEKGVSLVELMIAMVLASLLGVVVLNTLYAALSDNNLQHALAALQQSEQHVTQSMQDIAREAGYFFVPDASTTAVSQLASSTFFPAYTGTYGRFAAGQVVYGTDNLLDIRFQSVMNTNPYLAATVNCAGQANTGVNPVLYDNAYFLSGSNLECAVNGGTSQVVISGVENMGIMYGVGSSGSENSYETAQEVSANNAWSKVISAQVTLYMLLKASAQAVPFTFNLNFRG